MHEPVQDASPEARAAARAFAQNLSKTRNKGEAVQSSDRKGARPARAAYADRPPTSVQPDGSNPLPPRLRAFAGRTDEPAPSSCDATPAPALTASSAPGQPRPPRHDFADPLRSSWIDFALCRRSVTRVSDGGPRQGSVDADVSPALETYKAIRAHELMLNQATSAFEHATLAPLLLLNGGAAVAYLTLLGALVGREHPPVLNRWLVAMAVLAWVLGLIAAQVSVTFGYLAQRGYSKSHRIKREQVEQHIIRYDKTLADILVARAKEGAAAPEGDELRNEAQKAEQAKQRESLTEEASGYQDKLQYARWISIGLFGAGTALAAGSVLAALGK